MKMKNLLIIMSVLLVVSACASTRSYRDVEKSGFLGSDAARLRKGDKDQPALVYLKPGVDWASYNKMLLDPVTFWRPPETGNQGVSHQDIQTVVDYFYPLIYQKFSQEMEMVKIPRPDTLRVKVAITKAEKSHVVLDVVSTVVPQLRAISALKDLVTGKPAFVGEVEIEMKVTDAMTGELLYECVAARVGGKTLDAKHFESWGEVDEATDHKYTRDFYNPKG